MRWILLFLAFAAGFGAGAWRAGKPTRSRLSAAGALPLAMAVLAGMAIVYVLLTAPPGQGDWSDIAVWSIVAIGGALSLLAFVGGLLGAWWRRAG